jgi:hypothetical protein
VSATDRVASEADGQVILCDFPCACTVRISRAQRGLSTLGKGQGEQERNTEKERELYNRTESSGLLYPREDTRHGVWPWITGHLTRYLCPSH